MLVKLDHFPRDRGETKKNMSLANCGWLHPVSPPASPSPWTRLRHSHSYPLLRQHGPKGSIQENLRGKKNEMKKRWESERSKWMNGMEWNEMQWNGMSAWVNEWMPTCLHAWIYGYMDFRDIHERTNEWKFVNESMVNESGEWNQFNAPQAHVAEVFWIAAVPTMDQHQKCPSPWYLGAKWQRCQVQACKGFRPSIGTGNSSLLVLYCG